MWFDTVRGFVNSSAIEYVEVMSDGPEASIRLYLISGRVVEISGGLAYRMLVYLRGNKITLMDKLGYPATNNGSNIV